MTVNSDTIGAMPGYGECCSVPVMYCRQTGHSLPGLVPLGDFRQDGGFFSGSPLLHPGHVANGCGFPMETVPYRVQGDNVIGTVVILSFFLLAILLRTTRSFVSQQANGFFRSSSRKDTRHEAYVPMGVPTVALMYCLLAVIGSLLVFCQAYATRNLFLCRISPYAMALAYAGVLLLFFVSRSLLSSFINWIFFDKASRRQWRSTYNLMLLSETVLLFPIVSAGIYLSVPSHTVLCLTATVIALLRLVLLYKAFTTFLFKIYCILHLLSYLCTLEIIPLLLLWEILNSVTDSLVITF